MLRGGRAIPVVRTVLVAALALGGVFQVVRSAVVQQEVARQPDVAAMLWPDHPRVTLAIAMADIGKAAAAGGGPSADSLARTMSAAQHAPLAVEPFLIKGAIAQSEQRSEQAERLFVEAARRDPRSSAARFFLSQLYLSSGRPGEGLREASVLARLVSGGSAALVPAIAAYAKSPGAVATLQAMFARDPALRDGVLAELARDANNYASVMALAGRDMGNSDPAAAPAWQGQMLRALIERGDLARARALWLRISGLSTAPIGVFNPQFAKLSAPAPFNWTFGSGDFGFAEPTANASLQIVYYGRANAELARQTLLLAPGTYELRMRVMRESDTDQPSGLAWSVVCGTAANGVLTLPVGDAKGGARAVSGRFAVPAGCPSQTIRLVGTASDYAASEQLTINNFQLVRIAS